MKIIIAGFGFVGKAVHSALKAKHDIVIVDPKYTTNEIQYHHDADGIIICVGTPSAEDGSCDDSQIKAVLAQVPIFLPVLIKSTIPPDQLINIETEFEHHSICYSPEFLRAKSAEFDFANQQYMVLGGEDPECFWQDLFTSVLEKCKLYFNCSITEASIIKYTANSFLATKVAFFNHIYDLCQSNGADYEIVRQIISHDQRIGNSHTLVPGVDGDRGFGGHCFPKDTKAFMKYANDLNISLDVLKAAMDYNKTVRKTLDL
jgi:UDPglucose 6-dehydrogenase